VSPRAASRPTFTYDTLGWRHEAELDLAVDVTVTTVPGLQLHGPPF
jgi:hypothetical protein